MESLDEFYRKNVERFLKTVVCFDDKPFIEPQKIYVEREATEADDGFTDVKVITDKGKDIVVDDPRSFDFTAITKAFAKKEILCSVINPDLDSERALLQIKNLAGTADVIILDWELHKNDTSIARRAIIDTIKSDQKHGGRLRLILIYSAGDGPGIIGELSDELQEYGLQRNEACLELKNEYSVITFYQKPYVVKPTAQVVQYGELPGKVIELFGKLTSGLLPAAALAAISVIRENTHQLLASFPAKLDGAFLAHRCLIPDPNDAEQYLLDLIQGELGTLLVHSEVRYAVNAEHCGAWINKRKFAGSKSLISALTKYNKNKKELFKNALGLTTKEAKRPDKIADKLMELLYSEKPGDEEDAKVKMSYLSTLDVSRHNYKKRGIASYPRLHLGSILKETNNSEYLLCIQPLCDSIRIAHNSVTCFPFLILHNQTDIADGEKKLDLCVPGGNDGVVWLRVVPSPNNLISHSFTAKSPGEAFVEAERKDRDYIFRSMDDKNFEWIADLKIGKAQRIASELASRIHTLGIDEFEWMRIHQRRR